MLIINSTFIVKLLFVNDIFEITKNKKEWQATPVHSQRA